MHNLYVIDKDSVGVLKSKPLLLDTNFIFDSIVFSDEAVELLAKLHELDCELLTTRAVIVEVMGGTKNPVDLQAKIAHLELLFGKTLGDIVCLPIDGKLPNIVDLLTFSQQCHRFGTVDFELFLTLKKYKRSGLTLVTRNHLDFTSKMFNRKGFITLLGDKEIKTFGIYTAK